MINEKIANAAAVGAVASPIWLPTLSQVSQVAALVAPILGVVWLVIQIADKVVRMRKRNAEEK